MGKQLPSFFLKDIGAEIWSVDSFKPCLAFCHAVTQVSDDDRRRDSKPPIASQQKTYKKNLFVKMAAIFFRVVCHGMRS